MKISDLEASLNIIKQELGDIDVVMVTRSGPQQELYHIEYDVLVDGLEIPVSEFDEEYREVCAIAWSYCFEQQQDQEEQKKSEKSEKNNLIPFVKSPTYK